MWVARPLEKPSIDTFEEAVEHAAQWMRTPNLALDNRPPFEVAQNAGGFEQVLAVLTRDRPLEFTASAGMAFVP